MELIRPRLQTILWKSPDGASTQKNILVSSKKNDQYLAKVIAFIPGEIIAAYQVGIGILSSVSTDTTTMSMIWAVLLLMLTPLWMAATTRKKGQDVAWLQVWSSIIAYIVWVIALGGPFVRVIERLGVEWVDAYGSLLLIFFTLTIPLLEILFPGKPVHEEEV